MSDYEVLLEEYFELKSAYEKKYKSKKGSIINNKNISRKEKRALIDSLKMPCIKCKRKVGTIFYNENNIYGALCGDTSKPCGLNIELKKQSTINMIETIKAINIDIISQEMRIKNLKLSLMFGLVDETILEQDYQDLKEEFKGNLEFKETLVEQININTDKVRREEEISLLKKEYYENVDEIKSNMKDYMINNNKTSLTNAVEIYVDDLVGIIERIRDNEYDFQGVELETIKNDEIPNINIIQVKDVKQSYELVMDEGEIISFTK